MLLVQLLTLVLLLALLLLPMLLLQGLVTDAKQVDFFTNATAYEDWPSGGLLGNGTGQRHGLCPAVLDCMSPLWIEHSSESLSMLSALDAAASPAAPSCCVLYSVYLTATAPPYVKSVVA